MILAELHCHSNFSDGVPSVKEILEKARRSLDAIAITDHNTGDSSKLAIKLAKKYNMLVIPGIEIDCNDENGQILALGTNETISGNILDVIDKIHSAGGIAIAAHPFGGSGSPDFENKDIIKELDAVEVLNGLSFSWQNKKAKEFAKKMKMPMIAGSDAHTLEELGLAACKIPANNVDDILKAIKNGKVILPRKSISALSVITSKIKRRL